MNKTGFSSFVACLLGITAAHAAEVVVDPPKNCDACAGWNQPFEPFQVWGNTWYVGTKGLSAILITSDQGHVLIDGGLPQSAPLIAANIEKAGFHLEDVKLILNSHTHFDHAGGIAALQRASGAQVAASPKAKAALERGGPTEDDPQFGFGPIENDYAPVQRVIEVRDGGNVKIGGRLVVTAHYTPGHTPGGTTWSWRACDGDHCIDVVYADSLNAVSAPDFRFRDHTDVVEALLRSMGTVAGLCQRGILLAPHPELFDRDARLARRADARDVEPFVSNDACRAYADAARQRLEKRLTDEKAAKR